MESTINIALATSVDNQPNVRIVTYGYDPANPKTLYFTTFKGNKKIQEFEQNEKIALIPLLEDPDVLVDTDQVQVRIFGSVQKAKKSLDEVASLILKKAPFFAETLTQREFLEVYEVVFEQAFITIGMEDARVLEL